MRLGCLRVVLLTGLFGVASLPAFGGQVVNAAIPFAFTAGDREFSAGRYSFELRTDAGQMSIKGPKERAIVRAMSLPFQGDVYAVTKRYEISFKRYDDSYFLAEVWIKHFGMELLKSAAEASKAQAGESPSVVKLKVASN